ncbi:MAG: glycoside hydrolase family 3 C-terminal domain-containing protein [Clostridia bacterium]|nr:glycoside hydrolase family 3 C-terminal domain-containing protein [Clostridia bacterium]
MKFTTKIGEVCFACSATLLAVVMALTTAGAENASVINSALGATTYRVETVDDGTEEDTEYYKATYTSSSALSADYAALCEEVEGEGIVLLKNDNNALPLDKGSKVSLFGQGAVNFNYNTTGSSSTGSTSSYATLKDAFEYNDRMTVNPTLWSFYNSSTYSSYGRSYSTSGYKVNEAPYSIYTDDVKSSYYTYNDAAIVVISRDSGEGSDSTTYGSDGLDGSYLSITETEQELLEELTAKKGSVFKSLIVIINTSLGMQLDFLDYSGIDVDACLWVGNAGSHGSYAIGAVLVGDVNPSGRSTDTYLKDNFSSPAMASWAYNTNKKFTQSYTNYKDYDFINTTNRYYGVYVEGIYVGYRYYETRYEDYVMGTANVGSYDYSSDVAYPFGYGLSYSEFEYSDYTVTENEDNTYTVSVTVTNTSSVAGKEVVQVYLQKPYTDYDIENGVEKASVELVGYAKTEKLNPNESETVEIVVDKEQFKTYDSNKAQTYILDAGTYYLTAAENAHDAVNNILAKKGYTTEGGKMDADGNAELVAVALEQSSLDTTTYKYSTETGAEITNQFDFCDVNRYSGSGTNSVTYVSRSNWTGTFPNASVSLAIATEEMAQDLQSDNEVEEDGSEMPTYGASNGLTLIMLRGYDYDDETWDDLLDQMTFAEQALLISDGYHLTNMVSSVGKPQTTDENGPTSVSGSVTGYCLPSEGIWAATFNDELIERVGNLLGDDCIMAGVQGLYAPGVNIHRTPFGGRSHEYFSEDSYLTAMASVAEIKGIQDRGVIAYVKHLAFNNEETNRNGVGIWLNEQSARELYLLPFEYSMRPSMGNAHATMTSFNRAGCTWTSASSELMLNVIRDEWDFDGFAITDASSGNGAYYMTYYDGIMNGTNLYDGTGTSTSLDKYKSSARFANMMRESCHRILYVVCNYSAAMNGISSNTKIVAVTPWWQTLLTVLEGVSIALIVGSAAVYATALVFEYKKPKKEAEDNSGDKE